MWNRKQQCWWSHERVLLTPLYWIATLLYLININLSSVQCSSKDGKISVGDYVNNTVYEVAAYSVYKINNAVSVRSMTFEGALLKGTNDALFSMRHVPCPDHSQCHYADEEQLAVRIDMNTYRIKDKFNLPLSDGELLRQNDFQIAGSKLFCDHIWRRYNCLPVHFLI
jgi:hypothetical protein